MTGSDTDTSKRQGALHHLWGIVVHPRSTLMTVSEHERRTWWLPALLILLLTSAAVIVAGPIRTRQMREEMRVAQEEMSAQMGQELSEEELARVQSITASPMITVVFPTVSAVVGRVAGWLIWAGVLYLASMALGGRGTFGQMFPMTVWSEIPYALRGLLQAVYISISGQMIANPGLSGLLQQPSSASDVMTSPPSPAALLLRGFLSRFDLFLIWHLVLLVIGVAVVTRLSQRKSMLTTIGVWVLLTALSLIPTLIGGLFAASQMGM